MSTNLVTVNDIAASIVGYAFASVFATCKPSQQAVQSFVVSAVARMISNSVFMAGYTSLNASQKNQLIVAALSAASSKAMDRSVGKGTMAGVCIDLLAEDVVRMLGLNEQSILDFPGIGGSVPVKAIPVYTGPVGPPGFNATNSTQFGGRGAGVYM